MLHSSQRDNIRVGNEPCDGEYEKSHLCLHNSGAFSIFWYRAKPMTGMERSGSEVYGDNRRKKRAFRVPILCI